MDLILDEDTFIRGFQERLQQARRDRGLSQEQLAMLLGLNKNTYKKYETRAGSSFPLYLLPALCVHLAKPLDFWIYGDLTPRRMRLVK